MRRKPVMVIGVAAVVLGVGVLAAGQAGAQETPRWPDVAGFSLSDLPGFSVFGGDSDSRADDDATARSGADATARSGADSTARSGADDTGRGADLSAGDGSAVADASEVRGLAGVRDRAGAPVEQRPAADQRRPASAAHAVRKEPKASKPTVTTAQRPAGAKPGLSQQEAGGSLIAAARRKVTAADISSSPGSSVQRQILTLINQDRRQHGCGGVSLDRRLINAANSHAADMARHGYFAHESRDGKGAGDRVTHAGYNWRHYGENIARGVNSPYAVVNGWMHSPEHRHNILDCSLDQMGIGLAIAGDRYRTIYWVQDFATPM